MAGRPHFGRTMATYGSRKQACLFAVERLRRMFPSVRNIDLEMTDYGRKVSVLFDKGTGHTAYGGNFDLPKELDAAGIDQLVQTVGILILTTYHPHTRAIPA